MTFIWISFDLSGIIDGFLHKLKMTLKPSSVHPPLFYLIGAKIICFYPHSKCGVKICIELLFYSKESFNLQSNRWYLYIGFFLSAYIFNTESNLILYVDHSTACKKKKKNKKIHTRIMIKYNDFQMKLTFFCIKLYKLIMCKSSLRD